MHDDNLHPEDGFSFEEPIFIEIERDGLSATAVSVPDLVMDGWTIRIFPTLDDTRVIVGLNREWIQDLLFDEFTDGGSLEGVKEYLHEQTVKSVHWYFKSVGKV